MCGIVGLIAKNDSGRKWMAHLSEATHALAARGPDAEQHFVDDAVAFGHCRLSIIDLSEAANQPMRAGEHVITYNGEIFNFQSLRKNLEDKGAHFETNSDTEVLLHLFKRHGEEMFSQLNGFFAFAVYDSNSKSCLLARDRFGVKPLYYYEDDTCLLFASELKALLRFPVPRIIDHESLFEYLQLNYIPGPNTIFQNIRKLPPGHFLKYTSGTTTCSPYYSLAGASDKHQQLDDYEAAKAKLFELLDDAVRLRLIADVPLGCFLSGGLDSSIISGLASRYTRQLRTFSIGYREDEFFDETDYARNVARHFNTDHTVFSLRRDDLFEAVDSVLDYLDEPFGDSSALPVFLLSRFTRKEVKVALSGDGADELFGGYRKHLAAFRAMHPGFGERAAALLHPIWRALPKSRSSVAGNYVRQLDRFASGYKRNSVERYWRWCSIADAWQAHALFDQYNEASAQKRKEQHVRFLGPKTDLNDMLMNDVHLVLPDDMLRKVDSMSMANGLEVRTPFLDYRIAEFAFSIPARFKFDGSHGKKVVHDAFRSFLPPELYHRPKQGFEIPLHSFMVHELKAQLDEATSERALDAQGLFHPGAVAQLRKQLFSSDPADSAARMWGLFVFQRWWNKMLG